ncbi:hypothetical protein TcasGA2_TC001457 [Tribolium castaneum]|uniref:Uncharacterized protein n=1 Tax=Tribolium castaneum TaxID=7070 RepID=D7EIJ6_TRICA|nr:hypothetical protein TcasGA2_TC001457 [Tribolium castaneum]
MRVPWVPSQTFIVRLFPLPSLHIRVSRDYGWRMLTSIRPTLPQRLVCYRYNFSPSHVTCCSSIAIKYRTRNCPNPPTPEKSKTCYLNMPHFLQNYSSYRKFLRVERWTKFITHSSNCHEY